MLRVGLPIYTPLGPLYKVGSHCCPSLDIRDMSRVRCIRHSIVCLMLQVTRRLMYSPVGMITLDMCNLIDDVGTYVHCEH